MRSAVEPAVLFTAFTMEVLRTNGAIEAAGDAVARDFGLSSARWQVMGAIRSEGKPVAQIARERELARQSVQRVVNSLRREQYVRLADNPKHRRAKLVELTSKGTTALNDLTRRQTKLVASVSRSFSAGELKAGCLLLARLREAWDQSTA